MSTLWHVRWVRRLPSLEELAGAEQPASAPAGRVRCSIVVAARNEEARIEQTVRHLLAQQGIESEIIIVDDRSTDRTAEILRRLSAEHAWLRIIRVDSLPDGWLGKCHACHIGANAATQEWILFTDADCWLQPDTILRALRVAEREHADHITLTSGLAVENTGLKASQLMFLISLANWFSGVNRDRPRSYLGFGAFNLVRAAVYRECGGHEALRLTVLDDVKLGLLVRRAGKRTRALLGGSDVECHWGTTAWSMVNLMEKNYFAALDYRLELVVAGSLFAVLVFCAVALGSISGTAAGLAAAASPLSLILPAMLLARRLGWSSFVALCVPLMFPLFLWAVLNSTFVTLRHGGVHWRDTFYSLETLRAGNLLARVSK